MTKNIVTINGRSYDAVTGLAISENSSQKISQDSRVENIKKLASHAKSVHKKQTSAKTLSRRTVKSPLVNSAEEKEVSQKVILKKNTNMAHKPQISRSPAISKFANLSQNSAKGSKVSIDGVRRNANTVKSSPKNIPTKSAVVKNIDFNQNSIHPLVAKIEQKTVHPTAQKTQSPKHTPAIVLKNEAIEQAMKNANPSKKQYRGNKSRREKRFNLAGIISASFAVMLLAGYFTYLNIPHLSVRMAATQSGIAATYPNYKPDGYRLDGQISSRNNGVDMRFAAVAGETSYSISQQASSWDSSAVAEYVRSQAKTGVTTTQASGITIYTYDSGAAWVNKGILYTIEGDAPLSSEQIKKIATSM